MMIDQKNIEKKIIIDGYSLNIEDVVNVARKNYTVSLSQKSLVNMKKSRNMVENLVDKKEVVYGITTGFGKFSTVHIDSEQTEQLQENLIISHAVGVGNHLPE